jgi:hypothetical protein
MVSFLNCAFLLFLVAVHVSPCPQAWWPMLLPPALRMWISLVALSLSAMAGPLGASSPTPAPRAVIQSLHRGCARAMDSGRPRNPPWDPAGSLKRSANVRLPLDFVQRASPGNSPELLFGSYSGWGLRWLGGVGEGPSYSYRVPFRILGKCQLLIVRNWGQAAIGVESWGVGFYTQSAAQ